MALFGKKAGPSQTVQKPSSNAATSKKYLERPKALILIAVTLGLLVCIGFFTILSQTISQTTYYTLNQNVPARTLIKPDMLKEVKATNGTQPKNALSVGDVQNGDVYAKYSLDSGDILTPSNAGPLAPVNAGIPKNFVTVSFSVPAENAVAGNLKRGDYVDIIASNGNATDSSARAQYVLRHVLLVDVLSDPKSMSSSGDNSSSSSKSSSSDKDSSGSGVASLYTVAVNQTDATKIALLNGVNILLALSPADGAGTPSNIYSNGSEVFGNDKVGDSGKGTDPSFSENPSSATPSPSPQESAAPEGTQSTEGTTQP